MRPPTPPACLPAAVILQVSQMGLRPAIPANCPHALAALMRRCWASDPAQRPTAAEVAEELRNQILAMRPLLTAASSRPGSGAATPLPPA